MMRIILILFITIVLGGCGGDSSSDSGDSGGGDTITDGGALSAAFTSVGCAAASCHGSDGKRANTSLTHDDEGNAVTNLSTSKRDLASWTKWIREEAKSPMPKFTAAQYSDADLKADYTALTGRAE